MGYRIFERNNPIHSLDRRISSQTTKPTFAMKATFVLGAILPALALADGGYGYGGGDWALSAPAPSSPAAQYTTVHVTSTVTGTVTNTLTAFVTKATTSSFPVVFSAANSTKPIASFTKPTVVTSATGPAQVTANSAARGAINAAAAGVAGAALYFVL